MQGIAKVRCSIQSGLPLRLILCLGVCALPDVTSAQDAKPASKPHELLARSAGTWDCDVKMFFRGPQAPAAEFKGTEVNELVSGGKYLRTSFSYTMGNRGKFEGHSLLGFDPRTKRYVGTWVDNFTAAPSRIDEEYDEQSNTMTDHRTVVDGAGNEIESKHITTWLDDSRKKVEIFMIVRDGDKTTETKLMEMVATKRK
jgi:hypothetical protein